jgi:hypothetical protein
MGGNEAPLFLEPVDVIGNKAEVDPFSRDDLGLTCCISGVESERRVGRTTGVEIWVDEPALIPSSSSEGTESTFATPVRASSCLCMLRSFLVSESTFATSFLRSFKSLGVNIISLTPTDGNERVLTRCGDHHNHQFLWS